MFCLLLFCVLATSNLISGWTQTCDSTHSWWLYSAAHWETMPGIPLSPIILTLNQPDPHNAKRLAMKRQVSIFISHWFDSTMGLHPRSPTRKICALPIQKLHPVHVIITYPRVIRDSPYHVTLHVYIHVIIGHIPSAHTKTVSKTVPATGMQGGHCSQVSLSLHDIISGCQPFA